jgi:hypothetical protein
MPRTTGDLVGIPTLAGFAATEECIEIGGMPVEAGQVSLDEPATSDTTVTVTTSDTGVATVVGGGATIPAGQSAAQVLIDAVGPGTVELRASLDAVQLTQTLTVVASCEGP